MRSTALLPAIRRKFPNSHITWVTQKPADLLLKNNPLIDRVLTSSTDDLLQLSVLEFDIALVVDKGLKSAGVLKTTTVDMIYGFTVDSRTGAVLPATAAAEELWHIGLSDQKKFYENKKSEIQLAHEALELGPWLRDEYVLELTTDEKKESARRKRAWSPRGDLIVGLNTGCAAVIPYKKLTAETHRILAQRLLALGYKVVLLGGKEDTTANERIAHGLEVVQSPTEHGLRDGMVSMNACDIVVSGDSLGMHMAIALKKWTVAWFGPTCAHEIELYDRGVHVLTAAPCSPCWKRSCNKNPMCYDQVSIDELIEGVRAGHGAIDSAADQCLIP
ncbi:MAG TPA: glycosyltransferase family 9 protein [Bdellovibrionales bacterium]|nr:glycosyltransferase family 9 protein [Bdellovibrionales bacterium]